jgi:hypothetical protein
MRGPNVRFEPVARCLDHGVVEYLDLTPYEYLSSALPATAIGWLGTEHGVQGGTANPLTAAEFRMLRAASPRVGRVTMGWHACEFCENAEGNGEYRYYLPDGRIFAAPTLFLHYVERHCYRPPAQLLDALADPAPLHWDWRAEHLCLVLLDENADIAVRAEAAVGLACWDDRRAYAALWNSMRDENLLDCAGDEIGRSLAAFSGRAYTKELTAVTLHSMVQYGIEKAAQDDYQIFLRTFS